MVRAAYLGSFDPITYGHEWVIQEATKQFDEVIVGIGANHDKKSMFTLEERLAQIESRVKHLPNVRVMSFVGLFTDFLAEQKVNVLLRGLRSGREYDDQIVMELFAWAQQRSRSPVMPLYVPSPPGKSFISSSLLKAALREQSSATELAHMSVIAAVQARQNRQWPCFITGMSGAGKSHVARQFRAEAERRCIPFHHIDIDKIAHEVQDGTGLPMYDDVRASIAREFGADIIVDGKVDRKKLGPIVFNDPEKLKALNAIMEEPVSIQLRKTLNRKIGILLLDSALAVEGDMLSLSNNNVVVVNTSLDVLTARLCARTGLTPEQVARRAESQFTTAMKLEKIEQKIAEDGYGSVEIFHNTAEPSPNAYPNPYADGFQHMLRHIDIHKEWS